MPIVFESQIHCMCDQCGEWWASQTHTMFTAKKTLRSLGWAIGKKTYCPDCNPKRKKATRNE